MKRPRETDGPSPRELRSRVGFHHSVVRGNEGKIEMDRPLQPSPGTTGISWIYPPPRIPVANEGLGWDSLLKMVHNAGGDCYWVGGRPKASVRKCEETCEDWWRYMEN